MATIDDAVPGVAEPDGTIDRIREFVARHRGFVTFIVAEVGLLALALVFDAIGGPGNTVGGTAVFNAWAAVLGAAVIMVGVVGLIGFGLWALLGLL